MLFPKDITITVDTKVETNAIKYLFFDRGNKNPTVNAMKIGPPNIPTITQAMNFPYFI